ncbi:Ktr system potassium uptake protein B [Paenibacillus allorhizoplanae]|uniref:Ktr system potassium uptake protein B n=1 Tax=Paenibacillus allorhizoplanae TaxID=2905648 RepID=A0ABN8GPP4_9BACL|nr:potassium transporter TrkG [Paenibacillus allorhizoplanae]CAH1209786.1 Ktr system potassium uptake protein B [Paenibacillus allorhizoplanae]
MLNKLQKMPASRLIVIAYLIGIFLIAILLKLPISLKAGATISFVDALFTSASAVSVTGLTTVGINETLSSFGVGVLIVAFQFGGIGVMTLGSFYWLLFGQEIGLLQRKMIMIDQNRNNLSGLVQLMKLVLGFTLILEAISTLAFGLYFYFTGEYGSIWSALYYGMFHTISAFTNAGFDLFGNSLLNYSSDYFVQALTMFLIVLGGIGFPVLAELREYFWGGHKNFRFSLFTKLTLVTTSVLLLFGTIGFWLMERTHALAGMSWHGKILTALFTSVTSRSAGLTTIDMSTITEASLLLVSILMFIGASPSSMGGGVRTTTVAVIVLALIAYARGEKEPKVFGRMISQEDSLKSFVFFLTGIALLLGGIFILLIAEPNRWGVSAILFEVASAFGTCGLSTGITADLGTFSKISLIVLMFIGRIGLFLFYSLFTNGKKKPLIRFPEEKLIIG